MCCILSNHSNITSTNNTPTSDNFLSISIDDDLWNKRLQDNGCSEDKLPSKRYKLSKIIAIGPDGSKLCYYDLTAIAVDFVKAMQKCKEEGIGWYKIPKNTSNCKVKIVEFLLSLRMVVDEKYHLSQHRLVIMLNALWGNDSGNKGMHSNDKVRLFGIIMARDDNRHIYQRLAEGVTSRAQLDDPTLSPAGMYSKLQLDFNSDNVIVALPPDAVDVENVDTIDPNDLSRITIQRDCELHVNCFCLLYLILFNQLICLIFIFILPQGNL